MNGASITPTSDRLFVGFSIDGKTWHTPKQEGDKYISFEVNDNGKNVFQIIS